MTTEQTYGRFVSIVRRMAPECPLQPETRTQEVRAQANRVATLISALADGLNVDIPGGAVTSLAISVATANSGADVANAAVDFAATRGAGKAMGAGAKAGPVVGGAIMILRGTYQGVGRSHQVVTYLLGISGYVNCLARCAIHAVHSPLPYIRLPEPIAPSYIAGDLYTNGLREDWRAGYWRVREVIREIDNLRPDQGALYSKQCLIQLALDAGHPGGRGEDPRIRIRCEDYILNQILATNLRTQRDRLRRWANAP